MWIVWNSNNNKMLSPTTSWWKGFHPSTSNRMNFLGFLVLLKENQTVNYKTDKWFSDAAAIATLPETSRVKCGRRVLVEDQKARHRWSSTWQKGPRGNQSVVWTNVSLSSRSGKKDSYMFTGRNMVCLVLMIIYRKAKARHKSLPNGIS